MKHKVSIGKNNELYRVNGELFDEGEKIDFFVPFLTDTSTRVTTDDVQLVHEANGPTDYHYSFIMPDHDVAINVSMVCDMIKPVNGQKNGFSLEPPVGGFMGMKQFMTGEAQKPAGGNQRILYCPECGVKLETEGQKFCQNCGRKI